MSVADQQAIVNKHNTLRSGVADGIECRGNPGPQPPASNMRQMRWDADLAKAAQIVTDRCNFFMNIKIPAGIKSKLYNSLLMMSAVKTMFRCRLVEWIWAKFGFL